MPPTKDGKRSRKSTREVWKTITTWMEEEFTLVNTRMQNKKKPKVSSYQLNPRFEQKKNKTGIHPSLGFRTGHKTGQECGIPSNKQSYSIMKNDY